MDEVKPRQYHIRRREFLNEDLQMHAFIIGIVQDTRDLPDENEEAWKWGTVILDLGDCYRRISFDFDLEDEESRAKSLHKINLIHEIISGVRDAIALEIESRNARPAKQLAQHA